MKIKVKKMFELNFFLLICHFTPKTGNRGDLLPITTTNDPSVFLSNSVNDSQGLMCLKYKQFFYYKQHPKSSGHVGSINIHSIYRGWL